MDTLVQQTVNGLMLGSIYALIALGYTMVYGILRIINFAHGDVLMVGALSALSAISVLQHHFPALSPYATLLLAALFAMAVCAIASMAIERLAYRRLRNAPRLAPLISGIGVSLLLQTLAMLIWSRNPLMFPQLVARQKIPDCLAGNSGLFGMAKIHRFGQSRIERARVKFAVELLQAFYRLHRNSSCSFPSQ